MPSRSRRHVLGALGTSVATIAGCVSLQVPSDDSIEPIEGAWPVAGGSPASTRYTEAGPTNPSVGWTTTISSARTTKSPTVSSGDVYVPTNEVADHARHRYGIVALAGDTGTKQWHTPLRVDPNPSPAVGAGYVVVSASRSATTARIIAFEEDGGAEAWIYDIDARVTAPPMHLGTRVYIADWNGRVHGLSIVDGTVDWVTNVDGSGGFVHAVAIRDETLYLGASQGETGLVVIDGNTGDLAWQVSTGGVTAGPVVDTDMIAFRGGTVVYAFAHDGSEQWVFNIPDDGGNTLALDAERVYVPTRDQLYAISHDGEKVWTYDRNETRATPATVAGDTVLLVDDDELIGFAAGTGEKQWATEVSGARDPIVVANAVLMTKSGGSIMALQ